MNKKEIIQQIQDTKNKYRLWFDGNFFYFDIDELMYNCESYNVNGCNKGILIQYIGYQDKNGKDIYVGDIIKSLNTDELLYVLYNKDLGCYTVISLYDDIEINIKDWLKNGNIEIVGNIFEDYDKFFKDKVN